MSALLCTRCHEIIRAYCAHTVSHWEPYIGQPIPVHRCNLCDADITRLEMAERRRR